MKEIYEQNKRDVTKLISESIDQLVERSVSASLQHVRGKVMEEWKALHRLLESETARQIYFDTPLRRNKRIFEARHKCWIKLGAYSKIINILYKIEYNEF